MISNINWNLYRAFIAVYELKNFQRAAELLNVTRSAIGQNIKELENQLDVKLFVGHNKGVEPTSDAIAIYPSIKTASEAIDNGEMSLQAFTDKSEAVIRLAVPSTVANVDLRDYFIEFNRKYPKVKFKFYDGNPCELLEQNKLDLAFGTSNVFAGCNVEIVKLFSEQNILIASSEYLKNNKLSKTVSVADIKSQPIIAHKDFVEELASCLGIEIDPIMNVTSDDFIVSMTQAGAGLGYYFERTFASIKSGDLARLEVKGVDLPITHNVCAYNKGYLPKAARVFLDGLIDFCANNFGDQ